MTGPIIATIVVVVVLLVILFTSYVKSPPDKAYIISGLRKTPKILIGKAGLKLPFFERKDELLIKQISIDIKTGDYVPTLDFIGVNIDAVAKVKIRTDEEGIQLAMKNCTTGTCEDNGVCKRSANTTNGFVILNPNIIPTTSKMISIGSKIVTGAEKISKEIGKAISTTGEFRLF